MTQASVINTATNAVILAEMVVEGAPQRRRLAHLIARAWSDEQFKLRLFQQPDEVFTEYGIGLLPGTKVRVVEDDTDVKHVLGVTTFVLPKKPDEVSLLALERLGNDKTLDADAHCGHCHSGHCHCGHCYCGHCGHCHCGSVES